MTGRDKVNKQIIKRRKKIIMAMFAVGLIGTALFFVSKKQDDISFAIIMLGMMAVGCFILHLLFRAFVIKCPFCQKEIPWFPKENKVDTLSEKYCYCPRCGEELDNKIN